MKNCRMGLTGAAGAGLLLAAAGCAVLRPPPTGAPAAAAPGGALEAVFEAVTMTPVAAAPKAWADLTVLSAVPQGTRVRPGDALVQLDLEKLRNQIRDLEQDQPAAAVARQLAAAEAENLKQTTPLKLAAARRAQRAAAEDLAHFEKTDRAQQEKAAAYSVKSARQRLSNETEELKQLEKMYKADDLVEETEEIILQRQKFAVEYARYALEAATLGADWNVQHVIPRAAESLQAQQREQDAARALVEQTASLNLAKKQYELEKLTRDQQQAEKRLADLKADLERLALRAPAAGFVYYGVCESGKWTASAAMAKKLVPGGKLTPNEIILTIADPDRLQLKAVIPEGRLRQFQPGQRGTATLVAEPGRKFGVRLEEIGAVPLPAGGFEARLTLLDKVPAYVTPGMTCKVSFGKPAR